ncbi:MAG: DEAD/DEAH box helicase [Proteobacteria bacterium]|nr:DEAD/DEAH box helicase [Pseudomonadota bacterium]MBQ4358827.1 DEAD/DEAH box helicase [Pseudomonadota bacterium]
MSKTKTYPRVVTAIHATFVTRRNAPSDGFILLWGPEDPNNFDWSWNLRKLGLGDIPESHLQPAQTRLILPARDGRYRIDNVSGRALNMADAVKILATAAIDLPENAPQQLKRRRPCPSLIAWSRAAKFALELIARQCFVPMVKTNGHELYAVWQAAIEGSLDIGRLRQIAAAMPTCAHALYSIPNNRWDKQNRGNQKKRRPTMMWHPEALTRAFLDAAIDAFMRDLMADPQNLRSVEHIRQALAFLPKQPSLRSLEDVLREDYALELSTLQAYAKRITDQSLCPMPQPEAEDDDTDEALELDDSEDEEDEDDIEEDDADDSDDYREEFQPGREFSTISPERRDAMYNAELKRLLPMKEYVYPTTIPYNALPRWEARWFEALICEKSKSRIDYHLLDPNLVESLQEWLSPIHESSDLVDVDTQTGLWLEAPTPETKDLWFLRYMLVAKEDPSLAIPAGTVFSIGTDRLRIDQHLFENPQERLLTDLGRAAQYFEPLHKSLDQSKPEGVFLTVQEAWTFISQISPRLYSDGFDIRLPEQLVSQGDRKLRAQLRIGDPSSEDIAKAKFGLNDLASFHWEAALGDDVISAEEFKSIVALKLPLVNWHGAWVLVDPVQLRDIESILNSNDMSGTMTRFDAMNRALTGVATPNAPDARVSVVVEGKIASVLEKLTQEDIADMTLKAPDTFVGTLRPYQERGVAWLSYQQRLGLGCCLADDMGLGKTIQLICHILNHAKRHPQDRQGSLLICPMSVVGNWKREFARFAPSVNVIVHHGHGRTQSLEELEEQLSTPNSVVLTTYGLITRSDFLFMHKWSLVVLDEAQAIKNASTKRSSIVRELQTDFRVALTGTPIENRLAELWSILDFLNPGLLGTNAKFQRLYGVPIEKNNDPEARERLRTLVSPFILRRVKSDPNIIQDLPDKMENKVYCTLTREQATLYQALVDSTMQKIEHATGISRHGKVLALLTHLKQIVDHPAIYQKSKSLSANRSGKVQRLIEMLETIIENGERALVFTQYKEMGDVLVEILKKELDLPDVPFLHGSLNATQRDALVSDFQSEKGAPVFILSLKAGGTGLNLTAATHVFHFDRWWNPAVEDQATDRAYRIGQDKNVQVHKFLTLGTLEEKIDTMLEEKKNLSDSIVDATGAWITQFDTEGLRELFTLSSDAMIDEAD